MGGTEGTEVMGLGIAQPWMLPWLAAAVVPIVLAWLAMRRPRPVRFGATEFVARAARRQHVTRGGVSLPITAVRVAAVAVAALAAARPFTTAPARSSAAAGGRAVGPRIECVVDAAGGDPDGTRALRRALEALGGEAGGDPPGRPQVFVVSSATAGRAAATAPTLVIVGDGTIPAAADARRIATAVADGAAVLVCIGPRSVAEPARGRCSAWLEDLAGIAVAGGPEPLAAAGIAVAPVVAPVPVAGTGFAALPGPSVDMVAPLLISDAARRDIGPPLVLARTTPQERPLILQVRRGRGTVCVAAVPLSLPEQSLAGAAEKRWSDLAAWPVFVPLVDRLVERLLTTAAAADRTAGPERVPLGALLAALACGLVLADWALSVAAVGGGAGSLQLACRVAAVLSWLAVCVGMGQREPALGTSPTEPSRGIVVLLDRSPSMDRPDQITPGPLARSVAALTADDRDAQPLAQLARARPLDVVTVATDTTPLGRWGRDVTGRALTALAAVPPASGASRIGDAVAAVARGTVTGARPAAIVVVSDGAINAGRAWSEAARVARESGVPLVVVPAVQTPVAPPAPAETPERPPAGDRIRVLLVDSGPRFEWRFLARLLAADPIFDVETCFLEPPEPSADGGRPLPQTMAEWNAFDVVVLGDVPLAAAEAVAADGRAEAWRTLAEAASTHGVGIAWSPGNRWWRAAAPGPTWLPAAPGGARGAVGPHRLRMRAGEAAAAWLPGEPVDAAVFAVLRPIALAATARVLAAATPSGFMGDPDAEAVPAIVVDRLGAGTVLAHLCETWRWSGVDASAYAAYWRGLLRHLAEPHRLGTRLVATLAVTPPAAVVGEPVQVEAVPTRADVDLAGWQLELGAADATGADRAVRRVPLVPATGQRGTMTAVIDGLGPGTHAVRLVPPAEESPPPAAELPAAEIVVAQSGLEHPGGHADIGPLVAAARDSVGAVVSLDEIATLPAVVAALAPDSAARSVSAGKAGWWPWLELRGAAHAAMLLAVTALAAAWWPAPRGRGGPHL